MAEGKLNHEHEDPRARLRRLLLAIQQEDEGGNISHTREVPTQPMKAKLGDTQPVRVSGGVGSTQFTQPASINAQPGILSAQNSTRAVVPQTVKVPASPPQTAMLQAPKLKTGNPRRTTRGTHFDIGSCLVRIALAAMVIGTVIALIGITYLFSQYYQIASELPDIGDLRQKASQFETTRIYDRNGNVLYEILDPNAGRRTYVPLSKMSPYLVAATISTEDGAFYSHPGFDLWAIGRAFMQNFQSGGTVSGASTITQQLARNLLFEPDERGEQSYRRKIREAILAAEITRRYTKDEILELYINENYYGNLSYGIQAAAETYFGTTAENLTFAQAAFLAGLPQAPSVYDIFTNPEVVYQRFEDVLTLLYQTSQENGCIYVSNSPQRVCVDPVEVIKAVDEIKNTKFEKKIGQIRYPHWVTYIRMLLEEQYDPQTIYRSGFQVYTTLDPALQEAAEQIVGQQVTSLANKRATNGALVAVRPANGEILAMVGSADFYNEAISGQVNMALSPRQPGSAIKPLTYLAAFEKGWTPGTLLWDVPSEFTPSGKPDDPGPVYIPVNYDGRFHGPVTLRSALANSYNVPAVKTLDFVGIYDDLNTTAPDGFLNFARRMGITTLNRPDYGLSLTLGGGEVSLLELTQAYSAMANNGIRVPPVAILRILDYNGNIVYDHQPPKGAQVIRPEHAHLITSILSDNEARSPMFGRNSVLDLPFPSAAKTGTTNDFRDNWTIGYNPDLVVGSWIGNADYSPMVDTSGLTGAAPIWSQYMQYAVPFITGNNPTPFGRPGGIFDTIICAISGALPSQWCPEQRSEIFTGDQPPLPPEQDLWQQQVIDTWTGLLASSECPDFTEAKLVLAVYDEWGRKWVRRDPQGEAWASSVGFEPPITFASTKVCRETDPRPRLSFLSPRENDVISNVFLDIYAIADATAWFDRVQLEYGLGDDPVEWRLLEERRFPMAEPGVLYRWDLSELPAGRVTLKLTLFSTEDTYAETFLHLDLQVPTPTPVPTDTPLPTVTPTPTPLPSATPTPTETPTVLPTIIFPKATGTVRPPSP